MSTPSQQPADGLQQPPRPPHFLAGDGLRAIGCMAILLFHLSVGAALRDGDFSPRFENSYGTVLGGIFVSLRAAVPVFFAMSGYLVGGPFVRAFVEGRERPGLARYADKRIRRILPAFWLVLIYLLLRHGPSGASGGEILAMFGFQHTNFPSDFLVYIPQLWTVDVEMVFYIVLPLLTIAAIWLGARHLPGTGTAAQRRMLVVVVLTITALASIWLAGSVDTEGRAGKSLLCWWSSFVPGIVLAATEKPLRARFAARAGEGRLLALVLLAGSIAGYIAFGRILPAREHLVPLADFMAGTFVVAAAMVWQWTTQATWRPLLWRPVEAVGRWSYGIYLWHVAVLAELFRIVPADKFSPEGDIAVLVLPAAAISIALGALTWRFVETPLMSVAFRRRQLEPA